MMEIVWLLLLDRSIYNILIYICRAVVVDPTVWVFLKTGITGYVSKKVSSTYCQ